MLRPCYSYVVSCQNRSAHTRIILLLSLYGVQGDDDGDDDEDENSWMMMDKLLGMKNKVLGC